jgi:hypothetical protein
MTGHTLHGDNINNNFGAGNDLMIYHNGSNSYINNTTGSLYIRDSAGDIYIQAKNNENSIVANNDGSVDLYHDNAKKFETTATGFKLTGTAGTSPLLELNNADAEDNDTGRESSLRFTGKRSGGEAVINAQISGHHDGSADDDKGMMLFYTNGGSGSVQQLKITSDGRGLSEFTVRAWINFNGTGTVAIRDSHNVSGLVDGATGDYIVQFASAMPSANFSTSVNCGMNTAVNSVTGRLGYSGHTNSNFRIGIRATNNQAWIDEDYVSGMFCGG